MYLDAVDSHLRTFAPKIFPRTAVFETSREELGKDQRFRKKRTKIGAHRPVY